MNLSLPELAAAPDLVPADIAEAAVAAARSEVAVLVDSVRRAEADADELERRISAAVGLEVDEQAVLARVAAILDQLTDDAADRRRAAVRSGQREADLRLAAGRAEADRIRQTSLGTEAGEGGRAAPTAPSPRTARAADSPLDQAIERAIERAIEDIPGQLANADSNVAPPGASPDAYEATGDRNGSAGDEPVDLEGIDLSELAELVPVLEAMLRGEGTDLAAPDVEAGAKANGEAAATPDPAPGHTEAILGDAEDRFRDFWEADPEPDDDRTAWWAALPVTELVGLAALVGLLILVLLWIG